MGGADGPQTAPPEPLQKSVAKREYDVVAFCARSQAPTWEQLYRLVWVARTRTSILRFRV